VKFTFPLPVPVAPDVTVSQESTAAAVHAQVDVVVTAICVPAPPLALAFWLVGLIEKEQPDPWLTANGCPAIVTVPLRGGPVLAAAVRFTVPFPLPLAPLVTVIQVVEVAFVVHAQPVGVVTAMGPLAPPATGNANDVGLRDAVQPPA
jgi:hypothetical protein